MTTPPVDDLFAIPRLIFDRLIASYGAAEDLPSTGNAIIRPLTLSPLSGAHGHPALVLRASLHPQYNEFGSQLGLLAGTPTEPEHLDTSDMRALRVLVEIGVGKRYDHQSEPQIERSWYLTATADFGRSNTFDFLQYGRYWPLVSEMLEQFSTACKPFEGKFRHTERIGTPIAA